MASSISIDQSKVEEKFSTIALNELQKEFNDDTKVAESVATISPKTSNDTHINKIVLSGDNEDLKNAMIDSSDPSSIMNRRLSTLVNSFGLAEKRMNSICDDICTSDNDTSVTIDGNTDLNSQFLPSIDEQEKHIQTTNERHIMISYNDLSTDICKNIYHRLKNLGYKVWMDEYDLHGKILEGMAEGIQNAYLVLLCYTEKYSKSAYCIREAVYTFEKHIDFIPCRLQDSYTPNGWLGLLISDRLYIDFSSPNNFERAFKQLVCEIEALKAQSKICCSKSYIDRTTNVEIHNEKVREQFTSIIREYKESINKNDHDLNLLDKEELCELIVRLREQLFSKNLSTNDRNLNHDELIRDLFQQSRNHAELLEKITQNFSNPIDCKTIIKLSMAFMFVWTVKTHIIDAYLKL